MLTDEVRDVLQQARDLIADPAHWCRGTLATSRLVGMNGPFEVACSPVGVLATSWCAVGAVMHVTNDRLNVDPVGLEASRLLDETADRMFPDLIRLGGIAHVNDSFGHDDVLAVYDKVLAD